MGKYYNIEEKHLIFPEEGRPFAACHASNLCLLPDGEKMAVWFGGSREGRDDVAIWGSRTKEGVWDTPRILVKDGGEPHWNPVLLYADGHLLLFYKVGRVIAAWRTMLRISRDNGRNFGEASELVPGDEGGRGPVRCKPIVLSDGRILAGASTEEGIWTAYADSSSDGGKTWHLSKPIRISLQKEEPGQQENVEDRSRIPLSKQSFAGRGVIQPTLWESTPGMVHMLLRSSEGEIFRSDSSDGGKSWSTPYGTGLPNNNSGIDVIRTREGLLVLCMNPVSENFGPRTPLVLMVSDDNGKTWQQEEILESGEGEFSYPCILAEDRELFLTYTYKRSSICFVHLKRHV